MANTRVQNATLISTNIPDNTSGAVTPEKHREVEEAINDSAVNINGDTFEAGAEYLFSNGSKFREGAIPHGYGGGWARVCGNEKSDQWEDGFRYLIQTSGLTTTVIYTENINNDDPGSNDDEDFSFAIGSRWKNLATGVEYLCTQANEGDAIWLPLSGTYSITTSSTSNCSVSPNADALYFVTGNMLHISGAINVIPNGTGNCSFEIDLPFAAGNFTGKYEANGVINCDSASIISSGVAGSINGGAKIEFVFEAVASSNALCRFSVDCKVIPV